MGRSGAGYDEYRAVIRFDLTDLPATAEIETVYLDLYPLGGEAFFTVNLTVDRLKAEWWQTCPDNPADWQVLCDNELPLTTGTGLSSSNWWSDDEINYWLRLDITTLYQDWRAGEFANYGLMIDEAGFFNKLIFASADNADSQIRPRLIVTTKAQTPTLRFPLTGSYTEERISGYDFGDWWRESYCLDDKTPLRHTGIDLRAAVGNVVYAVSDGKVAYASLSDKWGGYVVLEHDNKWISTYTHVIPDVSEKQTVARSDPIAAIAYGNANFDPHLHFQVRYTPFKISELRLSLIGRLPNESCFVKDSPFLPEADPKFPKDFLDPKCLDWE
ncbi:MAG TPA: peptidoglycan DD-metalloendopeptidase family protein [Candidatus Paceibacterota bacterium]